MLGKVEAEAEGVSEYLSDHTVGQVPCVSCPDAFDIEAFSQLGEHGFDQLPMPRDEAASFGHRVGGLHSKWGTNFKSLLFELGLQMRLPIVAVAETVTFGFFHQLRQHGCVRDIRRGDREPRDPALGGDPHVEAETEDRRLPRVVFPVRRQGTEKTCRFGPHETADRDREAVYYRVGGGPLRRQKLPPKPFFYARKIRRLPRERRPVHLAKGREPIGIMTTKILKYRFVRVQPDQLPSRLDRHRFGVRQPRCEASLPDSSPDSLEKIVNQTKNAYNYRVQVHLRNPRKKSFVAYLSMLPNLGLLFAVHDLSRTRGYQLMIRNLPACGVDYRRDCYPYRLTKIEVDD